jgi:hypothetical protein
MIVGIRGSSKDHGVASGSRGSGCYCPTACSSGRLEGADLQAVLPPL